MKRSIRIRPRMTLEQRKEVYLLVAQIRIYKQFRQYQQANRYRDILSRVWSGYHA